MADRFINGTFEKFNTPVTNHSINEDNKHWDTYIFAQFCARNLYVGKFDFVKKKKLFRFQIYP